MNALSGRVVTDDPAPTFALRLKDTERFDQVRLTVRNEEHDLLWDLGVKTFARPTVRYAGPSLEAKTAYVVTGEGYLAGVRVAECEAVFETGFLGQDWDAGWIEPEQEPAIHEKEIEFWALFAPSEDHLGGQGRLMPCRELRKTFECGSVRRKARVYATAHGVYELSVNGQRVGHALLAPETSAYQRRLYYQTYDVTGLLCEGPNEIVATLADGWWIGRIGLSGDSCQYGDRLGLLLQLEWTEEGGRLARYARTSRSRAVARTSTTPTSSSGSATTIQHRPSHGVR